MPKSKPNNPSIGNNASESKDSTKQICPLANNNCLVKKISGPDFVRVGNSAEYSVAEYTSATDIESCKEKVKWRIECYSDSTMKKPIKVIEDCSVLPDVFNLRKDKLIITAIPNNWYCCIRVFAFVSTPVFTVSQITRIRIQPILLSEKYRDYNDDLNYGDYSTREFKKLYDPLLKKCREKYLPVCSQYPNCFADYLIEECLNKYCLPFESFISMNDSQLFEIFEKLVKSWSIFNREKIAVDLVKKVKESKGGEYKSPLLNKETKNQPSPKRLLDQVQEQFERQLNLHNGRLDQIEELNLIGFVRFNTRWEKFSGLGIILNGTQGYKIELLEYTCKQNRNYHAKIQMTIYDHFGLDVNDVKIDNPSEMRSHMKMDGFSFLVWFYLQRVRGYKPLTTIIENEYEIEGSY